MSGDCLNNIPYASVVGCIFCLVGAGVMGGTMWEALRLTNERIFGLFLIRLEWLQYVQYGVISLCGFVTLIALLLIVFGYLATKATRQHMYREDVCTMGGRCTACCCLSITYLLSVIWVLLFAVLGLPVVFWLMVTSVCFHNKQPSNYTFNLRHYGIYESMLPASAVVSVSGNTFGELCQAADYIGPLYGASFAGAFMVVFGLAVMIAALSCNGARLRLAKDAAELREAANAAYDQNERAAFLTSDGNMMIGMM